MLYNPDFPSVTAYKVQVKSVRTWSQHCIGWSWNSTSQQPLASSSQAFHPLFSRKTIHGDWDSICLNISTICNPNTILISCTRHVLLPLVTLLAAACGEPLQEHPRPELQPVGSSPWRGRRARGAAACGDLCRAVPEGWAPRYRAMLEQCLESCLNRSYLSSHRPHLFRKGSALWEGHHREQGVEWPWSEERY